MKKWISLGLVLLLLFGLGGCRPENADAMQFCSDGLSKLNGQNEYHYVTYMLEGSSNNTYAVRKDETENWISGENWLSYSEPDGNYVLCVGNESYHTIASEKEKFLWETQNDRADMPVLVPEVDLSAYHVESDEMQDGVRTITLSCDEPPKSGSVSSVVKQLVFLFEGNAIRELRLSKRISFPGGDGAESYIFYTNVTEYYDVTDGHVSERIQRGHEDALSNGK